MNLQELRPNDTFVVNIIHPATKKKTGIWIEIYGPDAKEYKQAYFQIEEEYEKQKEEDEEKTTEQILNEKGRKLAVACVKNWGDTSLKEKNILVLNDTKLKCTTKNVEKVFNLTPTIRRQVEKAALNEGNFLGKAD